MRNNTVPLGKTREELRSIPITPISKEKVSPGAYPVTTVKKPEDIQDQKQDQKKGQTTNSIPLYPHKTQGAQVTILEKQVQVKEEQKQHDKPAEPQELPPPSSWGKYLDDNWLKIKYKLLEAAGLEHAYPAAYLELTRKEINRLENDFSFKLFPVEAKEDFKALLEEESINKLLSIEQDAVKNLIDGKSIKLSDLPEAAFPLITKTFKTRLKNGETLNDLLPEAFAVAREATRRTVFMRPYDVQVEGGIVLANGAIIEMATGEGKTLAAVAPAYLNALTERGAHIVTVNDYLAKRDTNWMGPAYKFLGLSVGVVIDSMSLEKKREAYKADITYGTAHTFIFDYLKDNLVKKMEDKIQRGFNYAIVDEVDNIFIDEARTPHIISGATQEGGLLESIFAQTVEGMKGYIAWNEDRDYKTVDEEFLKKEGYDYVVHPKKRAVSLTEAGIERVESILKSNKVIDESLFSVKNNGLPHYLTNALEAKDLFKKGYDYLVINGKIIIVDQNTGRLMPDRRWSNGLHEAIEAKEGVEVKGESRVTASITLQNFFKMYKKLSGMSGTAISEAEEFSKVYGLGVIVIPPNKPCKRIDHEDILFGAKEKKWQAVTALIIQKHIKGQPVLVGTRSVYDSELLSRYFLPESLKKYALASILSYKLNNLNSENTTNITKKQVENFKSYLEQPTEGLELVILEKIATDIKVDPRVTVENNLNLLMKLWEIYIDPQKGEAHEKNPFSSQIALLNKERLNNLKNLLEKGIQPQVLNANRHEKEATIIAQAGKAGAVTIATNMAGRGTDIKLGGDPVMALQPYLEKGVIDAVIEYFKTTIPEKADKIQFQLEALFKEPNRILINENGINMVHFGTEKFPFNVVVKSLMKLAGFGNDKNLYHAIAVELQQFFKEPNPHPLEFLRLMIPQNPGLDILQMSKVVAEEGKNKKSWEEIYNSPKLQRLFKEMFGPLNDPKYLKFIEPILAILPREVEKASKEHKRVKEVGGLAIIGTERHDARRIDNQLRGRSARQGEPGESIFIVSCEDEILRMFFDKSVLEYIESSKAVSLLTRAKYALYSLAGVIVEAFNGRQLSTTDAIQIGQKHIEEIYFGAREHLVKYDSVTNEQRKMIYAERDSVLKALPEEVEDMIKEYMQDIVTQRVEMMDKPIPFSLDEEERKDRLLLMTHELDEEMRQRGGTFLDIRQDLNIIRKDIEISNRWYDENINSIEEKLNMLKNNLNESSPDIANVTLEVKDLAALTKSLKDSQDDPKLKLAALKASLLPFLKWPDISDDEMIKKSKNELKTLLINIIMEQYAETKSQINESTLDDPDFMQKTLKDSLLYAIDFQWVEQLTFCENLKNTIGYRGYAEQDPLTAYRIEAGKGFEAMLKNIKEQTVFGILNLKIVNINRVDKQ